MKKNGYTLVELLVTISILAVLTTATTMGMNTILLNQQDKSYDAYINKIQVAACTYVELNDTRDSCPSGSSTCSVSVKKTDLVSEGLLEKDLESPAYANKVTSDTVLVTWDDGLKTCVYEEKDK